MINIYHRDISRFRTLSAEEEQELLKQVKLGDVQARKTLIESNLRLVTKIARQYRRPKIELLDLIQEGNIGLIEAVDKFDAEMGYRFSTYAVWSIRKAIQEFLGEENTIESLDSIIENDGEEVFLSDMIKDAETILGGPSCEIIDAQLEQIEEQQRISERLDTIPEREREVLMMLYGFKGKPMSLQDIADQLGMSHERVRCIKNTALERLK
jgi:RNA polymerase nonessential primary-like sigma factor